MNGTKKIIIFSLIGFVVGLIIGLAIPTGDTAVISNSREATIDLNIKYNQLYSYYGKKVLLGGEEKAGVAFNCLQELGANIFDVNRQLKIDTRSYTENGQLQKLEEKDGSISYPEILPEKLRVLDEEPISNIESLSDDPLSDPEKRLVKAKAFMRMLTCERLYYPATYDPVKTKVDSAFYNYITDGVCYMAAQKIIDLRKQYDNNKYNYEDANKMYKDGFKSSFFGYGDQMKVSKANMQRISKELEEQIAIIKNRDNSRDGEFIGWQVYHKYRAANKDNDVSFGEYLYIVNKDIDDWYYCFNTENNNSKNLQSLRAVIEEVLFDKTN